MPEVFAPPSCAPTFAGGGLGARDALGVLKIAGVLVAIFVPWYSIYRVVNSTLLWSGVRPQLAGKIGGWAFPALIGGLLAFLIIRGCCRLIRETYRGLCAWKANNRRGAIVLQHVTAFLVAYSGLLYVIYRPLAISVTQVSGAILGGGAILVALVQLGVVIGWRARHSALRAIGHHVSTLVEVRRTQTASMGGGDGSPKNAVISSGAASMATFSEEEEKMAPRGRIEPTF
jgi:hypothetical protein